MNTSERQKYCDEYETRYGIRLQHDDELFGLVHFTDQALKKLDGTNAVVANALNESKKINAGTAEAAGLFKSAIDAEKRQLQNTHEEMKTALQKISAMSKLMLDVTEKMRGEANRQFNTAVEFKFTKWAWYAYALLLGLPVVLFVALGLQLRSDIKEKQRVVEMLRQRDWNAEDVIFLERYYRYMGEHAPNTHNEFLKSVQPTNH